MNDKPKQCPVCQSNQVIPIIYGMPNADLVMKDAAGEAVIGGVATYAYSPEWHCNACRHQWRTSAVEEVGESDLDIEEVAVLPARNRVNNKFRCP